MAKLRIYLAGPEVFLPPDRARRVFADKKAICDDAGYAGVSPFDSEVQSATSPDELGCQISIKNEKLMTTCDLVIANMTPFRGVSTDVGTAFEMGFMRALGKPVLAYSNDPRLFIDRVKDRVAGRGQTLGTRDDGSIEDELSMRIEDHGFVDNLMLDGAVRALGGEIVLAADVREDERFSDLRGFVECVAQVDRVMEAWHERK